MKVSRDFIIAIKLDHRPAYLIAQLAHVNPNWLSKIVIGATEINPDDERIARIAKLIGLKPNEVFANTSE